MSYSIITNNILKPIQTLSVENPRIYVIYDKCGSILDNTISESPNFCVIPNQKNIDFISFDIYLNTNPIAYSSYTWELRQKHIQDLVYFVENSQNNVKKEDKFLIQDKLSKTNKICRNSQIKTDWHIRDNVSYIEYGIPKKELSNSSKKSVVVLNTHKNKTIDMIFKDLKQHFPDSYMLSDIDNLSYSDISNVLQEFYVCIELQDLYNIGVAISNGCRVITNKMSEFNDYVLLSKFKDIKGLLSDIHSSLDAYDEYKPDILSNKLTDKYDINKFNENLYMNALSIIRKPLLL